MAVCSNCESVNIESKILISVIIPSYNRATTVKETIESIVTQHGVGESYDLEIVIGDDCSTDNSREVLEQYRRRYPNIIRLFFRDENLGLGANWAQCVKDSRGKYICNCDNDDYWHNPDKLQLQLEFMEKQQNSNICITNHRTHNRITGEIIECEAIIDRSIPIQDAVWSGCRFCNATIMYRAEFMKSHLDLNEWIKRRFSLQDWPAWVILAAYSDIDILPVSTATFGIETVSITRPDTYEKYEARLEKDKKVCEYLGELFPEKFPYTNEMWCHYQNHQLMCMAYRKGDYRKAKQYGKDSTRGLKQRCSQCSLLFYAYRFFSKVIRAV